MKLCDDTHLTEIVPLRKRHVRVFGLVSLMSVIDKRGMDIVRRQI